MGCRRGSNVSVNMMYLLVLIIYSLLPHSGTTTPTRPLLKTPTPVAAGVARKNLLRPATPGEEEKKRKGLSLIGQLVGRYNDLFSIPSTPVAVYRPFMYTHIYKYTE